MAGEAIPTSTPVQVPINGVSPFPEGTENIKPLTKAEAYKI